MKFSPVFKLLCICFFSQKVIADISPHALNQYLISQVQLGKVFNTTLGTLDNPPDFNLLAKHLKVTSYDDIFDVYEELLEIVEDLENSNKIKLGDTTYKLDKKLKYSLRYHWAVSRCFSFVISALLIPKKYYDSKNLKFINTNVTWIHKGLKGSEILQLIDDVTSKVILSQSDIHLIENLAKLFEKEYSKDFYENFSKILQRAKSYNNSDEIYIDPANPNQNLDYLDDMVTSIKSNSPKKAKLLDQGYEFSSVDQINQYLGSDINHDPELILLSEASINNEEITNVLNILQNLSALYFLGVNHYKSELTSWMVNDFTKPTDLGKEEEFLLDGFLSRIKFNDISEHPKKFLYRSLYELDIPANFSIVEIQLKKPYPTNVSEVIRLKNKLIPNYQGKIVALVHDEALVQLLTLLDKDISVSLAGEILLSVTTSNSNSFEIAKDTQLKDLPTLKRELVEPKKINFRYQPPAPSKMSNELRKRYEKKVSPSCNNLFQT